MPRFSALACALESFVALFKIFAMAAKADCRDSDEAGLRHRFILKPSGGRADHHLAESACQPG